MDTSTAPKQKRKRRTKAQMIADAQAANRTYQPRKPITDDQALLEKQRLIQERAARFDKLNK